MKTDVTFTSSNLKIAGTIFHPDAAPAGPRPAVVVSHPGGGVKEQTASIYAERLARKGYIALVFDAAYQGESEGLPRGLENPFQRAEDIKSAVSYLSTRDDIDPERIGVLGICASGGYAAYAAQTDVRIRALATVSGTDMGVITRDGLFGDQSAQDRQAMLEQSAAARTAEARGEEIPRIPWLPDELPAGAPDWLRETFEYYRTPRGAHPRAVQPYPARSIDLLVQYDSFALIELISPRPVLMIIGSEAFSAHLSRGAIAQAQEPKELFVVEGATHVSLYDQDKDVDRAVKKLAEFFGEHL